MTTGIQANGTDLDAILMPRSGTARANVNIQSNGSVDLAQRFEAYVAASTKAAVTNIQSGGSDLQNLFQKLETVAWTTSPQTITTTGPGNLCDVTGIRLLADGNTEETATGTGTYVAGVDWGSPAGTATGSLFECMYDTFSGTALSTTIGTSGTWYPISSTRTMQYNAGGSTPKSCTFNLSVGIIGNTGSRKTSAIALNQNVEP